MELKEEQLSIINFSSLSEEKARILFGLKPLFNDNDLLEIWFNKAKKITVSEEETKQLNRLRKKLSIYVRGWNEQELRERFIIPVIEIVDFDMHKMEIASFAEREMKAVYKNFQLQGKVEWNGWLLKGFLNLKNLSFLFMSR